MSRIEDRNGNFMSFQYSNAADPTAVEPLLESIAYTGFKSELGTRRSVKFSYEPRTDTSEKYVAGMRLTRSVRMSAIQMYAPRPLAQQLVRQFALQYEIAPVTLRSRLQSIRECDIDEAQAFSDQFALCRESAFQYENASAAFDDVDTGIADAKYQWTGDVLVPPRLAVADFNGDGLDDIIYTTATTGRRIRLSNGSGFGEERPAANDTNLLDYDGDSRTDVLENNYPYATVYRSLPVQTGGLMQKPILTVAGGAFEQYFEDGGLTEHDLRQLSLVEAADFDSDRRPDLLIHTGRWPWFYEDGFKDPIGTWSVLWNSGPDIFHTPEPLPIELRPDHRFVDMDGDGRAEILTRVGNGNLLMALSLIAPHDFRAFQTALPGQSNYVFFDFNGDGLADVLVDPPPLAIVPLPSNVVQRLWVSLGNGFVPRDVTFNLSGPSGSMSDFMGPGTNKRAIDYYLDGRREVLAKVGMSGSDSQAAVVAFHPDGTTTSVLLPIKLTNVSQQDPFEVLDVNGDGLEDVLAQSGDTLHLFIRRGKMPDLLTAATGTIGPNVEFQYAPLTTDNQTSPADCQYPVGCVSSKLWVVNEVRVDNGLPGNTFRSFKHTFLDGRSDLLGAGFLGFKTHVVEDATLSHKVTTHFDLSPGDDYRYPGAAHPSKIEDVTALASGVEHRRTVNYENAVIVTVPSVSAPGYPFFVYPRVMSEVVREVSATANKFVSDRKQTVEMDSFGNVAKSTTEWPSAHTRTESLITYDSRPAAWLLDLVSMDQTTSTDSTGRTVTRRVAYSHNGDGLLSQVVTEPGAPIAGGYSAMPAQPDGVRTLFTSFTYTPHGLPELIAQTDGETGEVRAAGALYDTNESMFPIKMTDALNHSVERVFEPSLGLIAVETDENAVETRCQYDGFGRLRFIHSPDGANSELTYSAPASGPNLIEIFARTAGQGNITYVLDRSKRVVLQRLDQRQDGKLVDATTIYDTADRVARQSRWYFESGGTPVFQTFRYDNLNRIAVIARPDGSSYQASYDARLTTFKNFSGSHGEIEVDTAGRLIRSTQLAPASTTTMPKQYDLTLQYRYGPFDGLQFMRGPGGYEYEIGTDRLGRTVATRDPDSGVAGNAFNAFGDVISGRRGATWKDGQAIGGVESTIQYDLMARPVVVTSPDGASHYTWDSSPHGVQGLAQTTSPDNVLTQFAYDNLGRISSKIIALDNRKYILGYHYDQFGRQDSIRYPDVAGRPPLIVQSLYSAGGQLLGIQRLGGAKLWSLTASDAAEEFIDSELGNGVVSQVSGSPAGVLDGIESKGPHGFIQRLRHHFESGRLAERRDDLAQSTELFEYDGLDRLSRWLWSSPTAQRTVRWDFDANGRTRVRDIELGPGSPIHDQYAMQPQGTNEVTSTESGPYHYDVMGRQTDGPNRHVDYTAFDLPRTITTPTSQIGFAYDAFQRRVRATEGPNHMTVSLDALYDFTVDQSSRQHVFHIWGPFGPIAEIVVEQKTGFPDKESITYLHTDHLGSITALTDSSGTSIGRFAYEPYGKRVSVDDAFTPIAPTVNYIRDGFTGQRHELTNNLMDFVGRIYDSLLERFLTPDPVRGNQLIGGGRDPYGYVQHDPLNAVDPTGFEEEPTNDPGPIDTGGESVDAITGGSTCRYCSTVRGQRWSTDYSSTVVGATPINIAGDSGNLGSFSIEPLSLPPGALSANQGVQRGDAGVCGPSAMTMCKQPYYMDPILAIIARDRPLIREDPLAWLIPVRVSARAAAAGSRWAFGGASRLLGRLFRRATVAGAENPQNVVNGIRFARSAQVPSSWTKVSRWMSRGEANAWRGRQSIPSPSLGSGLPPRTYVTKFGAPRPGGTGPVRVDFEVPSGALDPTNSALGWFQIFSEGRLIPVRDITIVYP